MNKLSFSILVVVVLLVMGCGNAALEEKVVAFEVSKQPTSQVEVLNIEEIAPLTGMDSLNYLFVTNLPGIGLPPSKLTEWTPDSMIVQYRKMISFFQISIAAFEQSSKSNLVDPDKYKEFITKYKAEMRRDSTSLSRLLYFDARRDSVLGLKYECDLKFLGKDDAKLEEVTKVVVFSKDKSRILGTAVKLRDLL